MENDRIFNLPEGTIVAKNNGRDEAHEYWIKNITKIGDTPIVLEDNYTVINFMEVFGEATSVSGVLNEQIAIMLLDRIKKLEAVRHDEHNIKMIEALNTFIDAAYARKELNANERAQIVERMTNSRLINNELNKPDLKQPE